MTEEKTLYPDAVPDCYGQSVKVGDTVTLTTQHPHNGKRGVYRGVERIAIGWGCAWFNSRTAAGAMCSRRINGER